MGSMGKAPVGSVGPSPPEASGLFHNKNHNCALKMDKNVNFFTSYLSEHNTVLYAKIAQSTELSQHVKQFVLATLKRHEFSILDLHF